MIDDNENDNNESHGQPYTGEGQAGQIENAALSDSVMRKLSIQDRENDDDFDPDAPTAEDEAEAEAKKKELEAAEKAVKLAKARETVLEFLDMYEMGIRFAHSRYVLPEHEREMVADNLAQAAMKYLPEDMDLREMLFKQYAPEICGVFGLYMLGKSTVTSIRTLKAEDAEERTRKREQEEVKRREQAEAKRRAANPEKVAA